MNAAYEWNRLQVAPEAVVDPGPATAAFYDEFVMAMMDGESDYTAYIPDGQFAIPDFGTIWRTYSIFEPGTGKRRSADIVLDRTNPNLTVRTKAKVEKVLFEGDDGVPTRRGWRDQDPVESEQIPTARCVKLVLGETICVRSGGRIYVMDGT